MTSTDDIIYENKIIKMPKLDYEPDPRGLGFIWFDSMQKNKDKVAQIDGSTGKEDTHGSLLQRCIRTALEMRNRGITQDDIICICTYNHLNCCVPFIATLFLGAKICSLDPILSQADTTHLIKQVKPKMFFICEEATNLIESSLLAAGLKSEIVVFGSSFDHFLQPSPSEDDFRPDPPKSDKNTAVIFFSSGSTGLPKGICISHYALACQGFNMSNVGFDYSVTLVWTSLYWMSAVVLFTISVMLGTARVVYPRYDPNIIWRVIDKHKITMLFLAPIQAVTMITTGRPDNIDTSSLKYLMIAGGPVSEGHILQLRALLPGTTAAEAYGQTEIAGGITAFKPNYKGELVASQTKITSVGTPYPGMWYKVVDPETEEILGPNQQGEMRIKADFLMSGYYQMDSSEAWDSEGYFKTGDVVYYDEDFCFYVVDRIKDILKYQSWHVPPALLEAVLLTHTAVQAAVVIGLPHPKDGDHPMGVVVLKPGQSATAEELVDYVNSRVDDKKKLRGGIKFIDSIPLTPTGKPKRKELKLFALSANI